MLLSSVFIGGKDCAESMNTIQPIIVTDMKLNNNKDMKFITESNSGLKIKIPPKLHDIVLESVELGEVISTDDSFYKTNVEVSNYKIVPERSNNDIEVRLNSFRLSPYLASNQYVHGSKAYVFVVIDTTNTSLLQYDRESTILMTKRDPKRNLVSCLVEITKDSGFHMYVKTSDKYSYKEISIVAPDGTDGPIDTIDVIENSKIGKKTLSYLKYLWKYRQKTRSFVYHADYIPEAKLTYDGDAGSDFIIIKTKEEAGSTEEWISYISDILKRIYGNQPRSICLNSDITDFEYSDMIKLKLDYVLQKKEDGSIVTLKTN